MLEALFLLQFSVEPLGGSLVLPSGLARARLGWAGLRRLGSVGLVQPEPQHKHKRSLSVVMEKAEAWS